MFDFIRIPLKERLISFVVYSISLIFVGAIGGALFL